MNEVNVIKSPIVSYKTPETSLSAEDAETVKLLGELNEGYGRAFLTSDVAWYDAMTTDDFQCITGAGHRQNKQEFLAENARPVVMDDFRFEEVDIRLFGDVAIIHAVNPMRFPDGRTLTTRYTDVWVKQNGEWKAASAQITRIA